MEFLLELLFEIIIEGSIELGSTKTVPMPLRIITALIVLVGFLGIGGFFIYMGYDEALSGDKTTAFVLCGLGTFLMLGGIFIILKMFRKKNTRY